MTFASNAELYAELDLRTRQERQRALNEAHLRHPQAGDVWRETIFVPILAVLGITGDNCIRITCKTKDVDERHYCFDESAEQVVTHAQLKKLVMYPTMDEFVADVSPRRNLP